MKAFIQSLKNKEIRGLYWGILGNVLELFLLVLALMAFYQDDIQNATVYLVMVLLIKK